MGANTAENTTLRLKAVLDVLAEGVWTDEKLNAGAVLGEAIARVPLNEFERELLERRNPARSQDADHRHGEAGQGRLAGQGPFRLDHHRGRSARHRGVR